MEARWRPSEQCFDILFRPPCANATINAFIRKLAPARNTSPAGNGFYGGNISICEPDGLSQLQGHDFVQIFRGSAGAAFFHKNKSIGNRIIRQPASLHLRWVDYYSLMESMLFAIQRGAAETLAAQKGQHMTKYTDDHIFCPFGLRSMRGMAVHLFSRLRHESADPSEPEYDAAASPLQGPAIDRAIEERRQRYVGMGLIEDIDESQVW